MRASVATYKTLDDLGDCAGKRVLVRVDFNVPMDEAGRVTDLTRIERAASTIHDLRDKGAKVI
ncbi:MAG: phosphoglycerate kinase, partial [Pseudomonadota bacterium]